MARSGGFREHPENINRKGRPKKGSTITDLMREHLQKTVDTKEGKKELREIYVSKVLALAMEGDLAAMKLIWNYLDGMPIQTNLSADIEDDMDEEQKKELWRSIKKRLNLPEKNSK